MSIPAAQSEAAALLARLTGDGTPVETHISAIFIGGGRALKLKKAVSLGFLDFTRLEDRERFCRRELELNAPAAPGIYHAVHKLTRAPEGGLRLGGEGEAVEWVLEMVALPPKAFLDGMADRGEIGPALLDALADAVAAQHASLPPVEGWDSPAALGRIIEGNVTSADEAGLPGERSRDWLRQALADLARQAPLLKRRAAEGRVRRCHGDLHLGNLVMWQGHPVPFDALEFDEAFATIDTGYDLAFLLADLDMRLGRAASNRVLNRYVARCGDATVVGPMPLWMSTRALVRAHVMHRAKRTGLPWMDAAEQWLTHPQPRILAVGGLPGTGKSFLARALAPGLGPAPGALILRSDEIRKRRAGVPPEQHLPPGAYSPAESEAVYAEFFAMAEAAARKGHTVIADAAFLAPAMRAGIEAAAGRAGVPFQGLWLEAPMDVLRARVAARTGDASDADLAVLKRAAEADPGSIRWARLDAASGTVGKARALL